MVPDAMLVAYALGAARLSRETNISGMMLTHDLAKTFWAVPIPSACCCAGRRSPFQQCCPGSTKQFGGVAEGSGPTHRHL